MSVVRQLITVTTLFLVVVTTGFAAGQREDPIEEAENLISERRYNEAIEILQDVARSDREQFDEAERLLRDIRQTRARYNDLWEQLIDILQNEPDNVAEANRIIEEMEEIDDAPTEQALEEFEQWRNIVRLRFNLNRFEEISARALELIAEDAYREALGVYAGGLGIFREEFLELDYDDELVENALESENMLASLGQEREEVFENFEASVAGFIETIESDELSNEAALEELFQAAEEVAELESRIAGIGGAVAALDRQARETRELGDPDPYLTFLRWFAYGRSAQAGREGMFAAVRIFVEREIDRIVDYGSSTEREEGESITELLDEQRFTDAQEAAENLAQRMAALDQSLELNSLRSEYREALAPGVSRAAVPDRSPAQQAFDIATDAATAIAGLSGLRGEVSAAPSADESLEQLESVWFEWSSVVQNALEYDQFFASAHDRRDQDENADEPSRPSLVQSLEPYRDGLLQEITDHEAELATLYLEELSTRYSDRLSEAALSRENAVLVGLDGVDYDRPEDVPVDPEPPDEDAAELTFRYPSIARERLDQSEAELQQMLNELQESVERLENPNDHLLEREHIVALIERVNALLEEGAEELEQQRTTLAELDERIEESDELREQVEELLAQSEATVEDDPDEAERLFSQAEDSLIEALELQQDPDFRDRIDERLVDLGAQIRDARYRLAVAEVREKINEGRSVYRQDNFGEAEDVLIEARELWSSVENTENSEVEYWLRLTQSALTLQDDRELTDTDPLFRALGSYLSLAYTAFEQARQAEQAGNTEEMNRQLDRAERNIQSVTVARPFNRDARVLSLQVAEMRDTDEFEAIFEQRFQQAQEAAQEDPTEALNDLYDLREVDPDWPGLEEAIVDVEILAGVREPPQDDTRVEEAEQLFAEAQTAFDQGNNAQARDLLEESIELNPDNDAARELLDEVRLAIGSTAAPTLTSSELQQFRRAENHFIDGQIGRALLIVERLWQDEENRDYGPLANLRSRMVD